MRIFDTVTQELKYKVLKEVASLAFEEKLEECFYSIPRRIISDDEASMHCCIYKDRAIVEEMIRSVVGAHPEDGTVIDVLNIACDECPIDKYTVSEGCRGCITHRCMQGCPVNAISIGSDRKAHIDQKKCIECGKCFRACPYSAIREQIRPCVQSCKINAIKVSAERKALIDKEKCVSCGACMVRCPFGAIQDRSLILDTVKLLKGASDNQYNVYAIIAPAIVSQFRYAKIGQIVSGIKALGVKDVIEVALGADITAYHEAEEFVEKGKLLSSCCPSFVLYVKKNFPALVPLISSTPSPMVEVAKIIKAQDPSGKVIFIGPCTSKKLEFKQEIARDFVDNVITFEELQALLDSRNIHAETLDEAVLDNASYYGRIFARSGGVSAALKQACQEFHSDIDVKAFVGDGLELLKVALIKFQKNLLDANFIEGMACSGGCINGGGCVTHDVKNAKDVDDYGKQAMEKTIADALMPYGIVENNG